MAGKKIQTEKDEGGGVKEIVTLLKVTITIQNS